MIKVLPLFLAIGVFLVLKLTNLGIRLSDTNIYFSIAPPLLLGKLLYKDIIFLNFPLFAYIASLYSLIVGGNLLLFYTTSFLEAASTSSLIYLIVYRKTKDILLSTISLLLYLFSFIILATSDHQTGVSTASLFATVSFFLFQEKKFLPSGIFMSLALLTKAYFLPVFLAYASFFLLTRNTKQALYFGIGFVITTVVVFLPSLIQAPREMIHDIFEVSLERPSGTVKTEVAWFFVSHDVLFFVILLFNLFTIRRNIFLGALSIWSILFFLKYQDVYYLYLNFAVPFLCISFPNLADFFQKKLSFQKFVIPSLVGMFLLFNLFVYVNYFRDLQKVNDIDAIVATIKKEKPKYLYGVNDITPALFYLTNTPPLDNVFDTHEYFFVHKLLDRKKLTKKAVESRTIVITHGAYYPKINVKEEIIDGIFEKELIYKSCKLLSSFPVKAEGIVNRINLFKCY